MIFDLDLQRSRLGEFDRQTLSTAVSELLRAHRLGLHLVIIRRELAQELSRTITLNEQDRATLARVREQYTQTGGLLAHANIFVRIGHYPHNTLRRIGDRIEMSLDGLLDTRILDRAALLLEDAISDGDLFKFMIRNIRDVLRCPPLNYDVVHGGGARTSDIFEHCLADRRIICVVVDTDANAPSKARPAKIAELERRLLHSAWVGGVICPTPVREAENFLPLDLIANLPSARHRGDTLDLFRRIGIQELGVGRNPADAHWLFFDIKEGCCKDRVDKLAVEDRAWIEASLTSAGIDVRSYSFLGFGENVLSQLFASNSLCSQFRTLIRHPDWMLLFRSFFAGFVWSFVANARQAT